MVENTDCTKVLMMHTFVQLATLRNDIDIEIPWKVKKRS